MKTLFQKIADKEIPSAILYEDDICVAIKDINPQAPVHILLFPRKPIPRIDGVTHEDASILSHLMLKVPEIAKANGLENGYRVVMNNGKDACETVPHMHIHIVGGRQLKWVF